MTNYIIGDGYWSKKIQSFLKGNDIKFLVYTRDYEKIKPSKNDNILIYTPPETHIKIADYFLKKDCYVFIEKPLFLGYRNNPNKLFNYNEDKIYIGNKYLYSNLIPYFKKIISDKKPNIVFCEWIKNNKNIKYGVGIDLCYHHFYLMDYLYNEYNNSNVIDIYNKKNQCFMVKKYNSFDCYFKGSFINNVEDFRNTIKIMYDKKTITLKEENNILYLYDDNIKYYENYMDCAYREIYNFLTRGEKKMTLKYHYNLCEVLQ
jgi:predicted dehydrogenase